MEASDVVAAVEPPRVRLTQAQAWALAERLIMAPPDRHRVAQVARALGRSESGLRAWMRRVRAGKPPRPRGRPPKDDAERAQVRALVAEERARQGASAGWRVIHRELGKAHEGVSRMLVEQELSALKAHARATASAAIEAKREHLEVLGRDTMWSLDGSHLGRVDTGEACVGEHTRDRASLGSVRLSAGPPATSAEVLAGLRQAARERGGFPLVLQVDNGSNYLAEDVRRALDEERVVLLISRVHTPTDNPAIEHAHAEVKAESGLGKGVALTGHAEAAQRAATACRRLDSTPPAGVARVVHGRRARPDAAARGRLRGPRRVLRPRACGHEGGRARPRRPRSRAQGRARRGDPDAVRARARPTSRRPQAPGRQRPVARDAEGLWRRAPGGLESARARPREPCSQQPARRDGRTRARASPETEGFSGAPQDAATDVK